ncbi:MAG: damage-control phosphatase ARMT1 family protein, partial [Chitinispirillaceae bacterium]
HAVSLLEQTLNSASRILFLCDNAGEIVFDRFLMESMPREKIICAVRGKPVINDATMEDARETGMTDLVKVVSNGSDVPGTFLKSCSPGFREIFENADLVIAKGQGNFETLSEVKQKKIFFLLQVKCPVISRDVGFPVGTFLIKSSGDQENRFVCNENHLTQKEVYHG